MYHYHPLIVLEFKSLNNICQRFIPGHIWDKEIRNNQIFIYFNKDVAELSASFIYPIKNLLYAGLNKDKILEILQSFLKYMDLEEIRFYILTLSLKLQAVAKTSLYIHKQISDILKKYNNDIELELSPELRNNIKIFLNNFPKNLSALISSYLMYLKQLNEIIISEKMIKI